VNQTLPMDNAQGGCDAAHVPPEKSPGPNGGQVVQPVVAVGSAFLGGERVTGPFEKNAEIVGILNEFKDIDDDILGAGVGHHPLELTHFMPPEFPQIGINGGAGFSP
jgi:hypothetical protein